MAQLIITFLGFGQLLAAHAFVPLLDNPLSTRPHSDRVGPRDQSLPNRTASFKINERPFNQVFYDLNLTVGTPPQDLVLAIQPLCPSGTWVASHDAEITNATQFGYPNIQDGPYVFDSKASSTAQEDNSSSFSFLYWTPTTIGSGSSITDNISIGGFSLDHRQVNLVTEGDRTPGDICLDDIGSWLRNASIIDEEVVSIWLNGPGIQSSFYYRVRTLTISADSAPGDILFGGVDTEKFQGTMVLLPRLTALDFLGEDENLFNLESMTILNGSETIELLHMHPNASFVLDHGVFGCSVPPDVSNSIYEILGGAQLIQDDQDIPGALIPCSIAQGFLSINFTFGYKTTHTLISVPISELMSSPRTTSLAHNSSNILSPDGNELCLFNVLPGTRHDELVLNYSVFHLGTSALKSVYAVFDKATGMIGVANAKPNVTSSNIVSYNNGCFPGVQLVDSSASSACAPVETALPTQIFTNTPTVASASPTSTSTSNAVEYKGCALSLILAASLQVYLCIFWSGD